MPWNRNRTRPSNGPQVPAEVEEYYRSAHKERRGVAWLLAFTALVVTILLGAGLFFGGRLLYRALFNNQRQTDNNNQATQTSEQEGIVADQIPAIPEASEQTNQGSGNNSDTILPGDSQPENTLSNNNGSNRGAGFTPLTGPETAAIPRTGPIEE